MAQDPRRFTVKHCGAAQNTKAADDTKRKDFFDGLGKIGDIEVLNRFGGGKITAGLRTLAKTSNSIRTGETDSAVIPNDVGYVLGEVGIDPNAAQKAGQFNPGVLNRGIGQAESILNSVKGGSFSLNDIPNVVSDLQNLGSLIDGIYTDRSGQSSTREFDVCGASPYAIDLFQFAPKYKFLFIVQINLKNTYQSLSKTAEKLAFVVKTSTRPNINIDHEEINMYNFWTRVPKRVAYEPITMRFYDDNKGLAHQFYTSYLRAISPISRLGGQQSGYMSIDWLQANSMKPNSKDALSSASLSALVGNNTSLIDEIKLFQIYDYGRKMTAYHFHHPKLLTMNLDDLDMAESGTGSEIEFQFAYDALHITPALSIIGNPIGLTGLTGEAFATYPIKPNLGPAPEEAFPEDAEDEDDSPDADGDNVFQNVTGAISSGISSVTGLVSSAFDKVADFGGSLFQ